MPRRQTGFSLLWVLVTVLIFGVIGFVGYRVVVNTAKAPEKTSVATAARQQSNVTWSYNGKKWVPSEDAPACADPLTLGSPADVGKASSVLYPGQTRGGNYKPHGGLRFDGQANEAITVKAPLDARLTEGARYLEQGETQYLLVFQNPCGISFRFDHLLTLSPALQKVADTLPAAQPDDSRTTAFQTPIRVKAGELVATAVGSKSANNTSFDFGVYDLRSQNLASKDTGYASAHHDAAAQAFYAVCWLHMLNAHDSKILADLPGGDETAGKTSDYC